MLGSEVWAESFFTLTEMFYIHVLVFHR